jgi:pimeloyl-ACP methyl ester carboxylesterase
MTAAEDTITAATAGRTFYNARVRVNGTELEYKVRGSGEPVVLVHGAVIADAFESLLTEPAMASRYRLISYHRRGYAGSARPQGLVSIPEQAADCHALLRHLGVARAHVVGHSYGGKVALALALNFPDAVHSLALLEPAMADTPSGPQFGAETILPAFRLYEAGDRAGAVDLFMRGVAGPEYRQTLSVVLPPAAFEQAVADADTLFQVDLPGVLQWRFTREDARRITQPVLSVAGSDSVPACRESHDVILAWLPQAEAFVLPNATHALQMMNPRGMAEALASFVARHPLPKKHSTSMRHVVSKLEGE